ncbi:tetraspanin-8-like [Olea europaea subsp. europaea]|uniref:Tetraspanin-8-like n=1 Tax=Olea europaea subsp. europaea TaxID=158383 RepID=A0A8S0R308_OLEEU|nr:tetraspanin-8-like [Olea europaea subsp. europaea]
MVRVSNGIITLINVLTFVISLTAIGLSLWFGLNSHTHCHKILQKPLLFVGLALSIVSLLGLFGSCSRLSSFMWIYLIILFLLIVGLVAFTFFTIVVTNKHVGKALSEKRIGEHRLGDYSRWLQTYVINAENWDEIKNCLVDVNLCRHLTANKGEEEFFMRNLSLIQSGCCQPPAYCGFQSQNATYWIVPKTGLAVPNQDCKTWSNVQKELCFDCESCKTAVLDNIKKDWRLIAIINSIILVIVIIVYSIGCCALKSNSSSGYQKYSGPA